MLRPAHGRACLLQAELLVYGWLSKGYPEKGSPVRFGRSKCLESSKLIWYKPQSRARYLSVTTGHRGPPTYRLTPALSFFWGIWGLWELKPTATSFSKTLLLLQQIFQYLL